MPAPDRSPAVAAHLAFTRPGDVSVDPRDGSLRARTLGADERTAAHAHDRHLCRIHDCSADPAFQPDLRTHGFAHADLSRLPQLQATLARVRAAGRLAEADAAAIRRRLLGRAVALSGGARMRLLYIAREGFFMRRAGPNGLQMPGFIDAAVAVHADQDVDGTPLRQILRGAAPWLFHHDSPTRSNHRARLFLVNVWIPLDQATRPLALMDPRTLDRRRHQLRHGLPTESFLQRREHMRINDIWTFLHDDAQRWYFTSELDARTAYVFATLGTPHGAFVLPGEARAEALYLQLTAAIDAVERRDRTAATRALATTTDVGPAPETTPLRLAIAAMQAAVDDARADLPALCDGDSAAWRARAAQAAASVVRTSIEMRAVAVVTSA